MCFPSLFPDGNFRKYHQRKTKIFHSEYIKSRLLNKDSRFRKDPRYILYLLWHKEMREISAGVYNILKSHNARAMSAGNMMRKLEVNDQHLDANLCTMLQTVRGTSQFWFAKQGELRCMVREFGTPTLFLTFSCAEYESHDIITYLRTVNNVPDSYNTGKLCTEDPVSVSRQFPINSMHSSRRSCSKGRSLEQWTITSGKRSTRIVVLPITMCCCGFETHRSLVLTIQKRC